MVVMMMMMRLGSDDDDDDVLVAPLGPLFRYLLPRGSSVSIEYCNM